MQSKQKWLKFVANPKYFNQFDWQNANERDTYYSTDFRKLLEYIEKQIFAFEYRHYHDKTFGVELAEPDHESHEALKIVGQINRTLDKDYENRLNHMPANRFLKWSRQNERK